MRHKEKVEKEVAPNMEKKYIFIFVGLIAVVIGVAVPAGIFGVKNRGSKKTIEDLQAQVQKLVDQNNTLQTQLQNLQSACQSSNSSSKKSAGDDSKGLGTPAILGIVGGGE